MSCTAEKLFDQLCCERQHDRGMVSPFMLLKLPVVPDVNTSK